MFLRKRALERIANEKVLYERHAGGDIRVCVVYPNIYRLGMANWASRRSITSSSPSAASPLIAPFCLIRTSARQSGRAPLSSFHLSVAIH